MENDKGSDQGQSSESAAAADGGAGTDTIEESTGAQPDGQSGSDSVDALDKKGLPPELEAQQKELLRSFHQKTQALSEKEKGLEQYKSDAQILYNLGQEEWFKKAVVEEKSRRSGAAKEISDEDFETIKSDKKSFQAFLQNRDKTLIDLLKSEFKGEFEKLNKGQKEILAEREFDETASEYGDEFATANDSKELDPYLDKGLSYEDAFLLFMQKQGKVAKKVSADSGSRRSETVERGGMARARGGPVVKVKNLSEALDRAFDLARKGAKDYRFEKA